MLPEEKKLALIPHKEIFLFDCHNQQKMDKSNLKKQFEHYDKVKDNIADIVVFWKEPEDE